MEASQVDDARIKVRLDGRTAVTTDAGARVVRSDFATVTATSSDGHMLLVLRGEFDEVTTGQLHEIARDLWANEGLDVLVDGSGITFASSALITALHRLRRCAEGQDHTVTIMDPSSALRRLLELTGLESWLEIDGDSLGRDLTVANDAPA